MTEPVAPSGHGIGVPSAEEAVGGGGAKTGGSEPRPRRTTRRPHRPWILLPAVIIGLCTIIAALIARGPQHHSAVGPGPAPSEDRAPEEPPLVPSDTARQHSTEHDGIVTADSSSLEGLDEGQLRGLLSKAMRNGNDDRAISLIKAFPAGQAREEECQRVFGYFLKNGDLERAAQVLGLMHDAAKRGDAQSSLAGERAKRE